MNKKIKYMGLLLAPLFLSLSSCSSDDSEMNTTLYKTEIHEISILNGGADGTTEIKGVIDENSKKISFPKLDPETDLSAVQFNATLSEGATLDKETYDFSIQEGQTERTEVIKVLNHTRYREYFATLRWKVPVFGGDFDKKVTYDHNAAGKNVYEHFGAGSTRGTDFNGEYALIISRQGGLNPHLLRTSDIVAGDLSKPIMLNTEEVSGGTFPISAGRIIQDKVYIANMAGAVIKVYMWEIAKPDQKPQVIFEGDLSEAGEGGRFGDSMDMYLDKDGNGYIFFENNASGKIRRIKISNFTKSEGVDIIYPKGNTNEKGGQYFSYSKVEGTPYYLYTGFEASLMLVDDGGNLVAKVTSASVPTRVNQAKIITFNEKRYLVGVTAARYGDDPAQTLYVYDITQGENVVEALENLEENNNKSIMEYTFGAGNTTSPGTNCGAAVVDGKLYIFGAADAQGFALVEVPMAVDEEE